MKKIFVFLSAAALIASCGNNANKSAGADTTSTGGTATKPAAAGMTAEQEKGLDLISKSDCLTCHKIADASTGPAYMEVAKRYAGQASIEDTLAQKIIKGGSGHWGSVPMTAHPQISEADAKTMVKYVLSVNNQ